VLRCPRCRLSCLSAPQRTGGATGAQWPSLLAIRSKIQLGKIQSRRPHTLATTCRAFVPARIAVLCGQRFTSSEFHRYLRTIDEIVLTTIHKKGKSPVDSEESRGLIWLKVTLGNIRLSGLLRTILLIERTDAGKRRKQRRKCAVRNARRMADRQAVWTFRNAKYAVRRSLASRLNGCLAQSSVDNFVAVKPSGLARLQSFQRAGGNAFNRKHLESPKFDRVQRALESGSGPGGRRAICVRRVSVSKTHELQSILVPAHVVGSVDGISRNSFAL
jgi:hypothetical protein